MKKLIMFLLMTVFFTAFSYASPPDRVIDDTYKVYVIKSIDFQALTPAFGVKFVEVLSMAGPTAVAFHSITHPLYFDFTALPKHYKVDFGLRWYIYKHNYHNSYIKTSSKAFTRYRSKHLLYKWPQNS